MTASGSRRGEQARVLAVDDEVLNLELLERSLRRHYQVLTATSPSRALEMLAEEPDVAVILSDYRMPGMTGTELLGETVSTHPDTKRIIITGYADNDAVLRAADAGEVDYVIKKPWRHKQLHQLLQQFVQGYQLARENRSLFDNLREVNEELEVRDELFAVTVDSDRQELVETTHELRKANRELEEMAYRDSITGLYRRRAFVDRLREEIARAQRYEHVVSLLYGDVDQLAAINHSAGRESGDHALREVARLMVEDERSRVRESDIVGRLAGEEFGIILVETGRSGAAIKAARLREAVARTHLPGGQPLTISFGMACAPLDGTDPERLLANAQNALAMAKRTGRNRQTLYTPPAADDGARYGRMDGAGSGSLAPSIPIIGTGAFRPVDTCVGEFGKFLDRTQAPAAIYVDMSPFERLRTFLGRVWHATVHEEVAAALASALDSELDARDILCRTDSRDFVVLLLPARNQGTEARDPTDLAVRLSGLLAAATARLPRHLREIGRPVVVGVRALAVPGASAGSNPGDPEKTLRHLVRTGRQRARQMAEGLVRQHVELLIAAFAASPVSSGQLGNSQLANGQFGTRYQPIVALESADVFGYRATLHGPRQTPLESADVLSMIAEEAASAQHAPVADAIARLRFQRSLADAHDLEPIHRLFVDIQPRMLYDTALMQARLDEFFLSGNLSASSLVLSVSEDAANAQFIELRRALAVYSSQGFGVAIHGVGQRCDLESLLLLEPHFIELSGHLIRGLGTSRSRREIVRTLVSMAHTIDALCIAPAVDDADDLEILVSLGVPYARGSFLARPGTSFPRVRAAVKRTLDNLVKGSLGPTPAPPADEPSPEPSAVQPSAIENDARNDAR